MSQLILYAEEAPAKPLAWLDSETAYQTPGVTLPSNSSECVTNLTLTGSSGRTCQESLVPETMLLDVFSPHLLALMPHSFWAEGSGGRTRVWLLDPKEQQPGEFSTLNISESPNDAVECSLSAILIPNAPARYYLSAKACAGILRRAENRGKKLPERLETVLRSVASTLQGH